MSIFHWMDKIAQDYPGLAAVIMFVFLLAYSTLWRLAWHQ